MYKPTDLDLLAFELYKDAYIPLNGETPSFEIFFTYKNNFTIVNNYYNLAKIELRKRKLLKIIC